MPALSSWTIFSMQNTAGYPLCSCLENYIGTPPNCRPECVITLTAPAKQLALMKNVNIHAPVLMACMLNVLFTIIYIYHLWWSIHQLSPETIRNSSIRTSWSRAFHFHVVPMHCVTIEYVPIFKDIKKIHTLVADPNVLITMPVASATLHWE